MSQQQDALRRQPEKAHQASVSLKKLDDSEIEEVTTTPFKPTWNFWAVYAALILLSLMSSIDATIITTSLPTIAKDIGGARDYVWVANGFLFASTATQPIFAQVSNIYGRRNPMLFALFLFTLGSGLAGGAKNVATLIAARTIQGLGTSGLYVLADIILCDLVPPRYRGAYLSGVLSTAAVGTTAGPVIGGALAQRDWRWVFWINLPVAAVSLISLLLFLRVKSPAITGWKSALGSVDLVGNAIFIPSIIAILFGLVTGGSQHPWSSWRTILPLVLGGLGWIAFHFYEASSRLCKQPMMPPRLFAHPTSAGGFVLIFFGATIIQAINYFLPLYFQAVKGASPLQSGVYFLPFALAIIPAGGVAAAFMQKTGKYIPLHALAFVLSAVGAGLFSLLKASSGVDKWIGFQIIASAGSGIIFTATMVSTLAPLAEKDVAAANGTYSFIRSFGFVWGMTIASTIFNSRINANLGSIDDIRVRQMMADGGAYAFASEGAVSALSEPTRSQVLTVFEKALRVIWLVLAGLASLAFFYVFTQKHVELRKENTGEYGLEDKRVSRQEDS